MSENSGKNGSGTSHDNHNQHKKLYHWVYAAGFCVLTGVVDFVFLWPESHLGAFLVLATALSLVTIYELTVVGFSRYWIVAAVIGLFALAGAANWIVQRILPSTERPRLLLTDVRFLAGAALQPGPLTIEWRIINNGKTDAIISEARTTPVVITGTKQLPEKPIYMNAKAALKGMRISPGVPFLGASPTTMSLTQEQVDGIKAGKAWLFYYGYFKYQGGEFDFIAEYNPQVSGFVRADDKFPAYSRAE